MNTKSIIIIGASLAVGTMYFLCHHEKSTSVALAASVPTSTSGLQRSNASSDAIASPMDLDIPETASSQADKEVTNPMQHTEERAAIQTGNANKITKQQAMEIASGAVGSISYSKEADVLVVYEEGQYTVTFPVKEPDLAPGEHYRGPPYAAKVIIDEATGKIIAVKIGS